VVTAIDNLEAMLARGQDNALLRYSLGAEHFKRDELGPAMVHLRQALVHDPRYSAAYKLLGQALAASGDTVQALRTYEDGIRVAEDRGDVQTAKEMRVFLKRLEKQAPTHP
jgi:predicted Zn-dependent protease